MFTFETDCWTFRFPLGLNGLRIGESAAVKPDRRVAKR